MGGRVKKKRSIEKNRKVVPAQRGRTTTMRLWWRILPPFLFLSAAFAIIYNGILEDVYNRSLLWCQERFAKAGLQVESVFVEGREYTSEDQILKVIQVGRGQPILSISPEKIRQSLESLPWIWSAVVQRQFPSSIYVRLVERRPIALWHIGKKLVLVDQTGKILTESVPDAFKMLPVLAGEGAAEKAPQLFDALAKNLELRYQMKTAILISGRRWNLILDNGIQVQLPEEDIGKALETLSELDRKKALNPLVVKVVDLRLKDKLIFRLIPYVTHKIKSKGTAKET